MLAGCGNNGGSKCCKDKCCGDKCCQDNPVIEAIMARRSIRHYTDQPVEREKLLKIAECGINAPNAMNRQDWEVRIVEAPEYRQFLYNAPAGFAIACPAEDRTGMFKQNVGLMSENICLAAWSLGLGTCIMYYPVRAIIDNPDNKPLLDKLGFSEGYELQIFIAVGYPDETPDAKPRDASKVKIVE